MGKVYISSLPFLLHIINRLNPFLGILGENVERFYFKRLNPIFLGILGEETKNCSCCLTICTLVLLVEPTQFIGGSRSRYHSWTVCDGRV